MSGGLYCDPWDSPSMPFGKYEDVSMMYLPSGYLEWMARTLDDRELVRSAKKELKIRQYVQARYDGAAGECKDYIVELDGDYNWVLYGIVDKPNRFIFADLDEALDFLDLFADPDIEDDRILVWEVLESGHKKAVWGYFGWHWSDHMGLDQGTLPGHDKSVYEELADADAEGDL